MRPELGSENSASDSVRAEYLRQFLAMPVKDLMSGQVITQGQDIRKKEDVITENPAAVMSRTGQTQASTQI